MKRICAFLAALVGIWTLLTPLAYAEEAGGTLEGGLTDHLASREEVKWYSFEMTEPGDAVLMVTGLQDHWDGYTYHWTCVLYAADRESAIAGEHVRGYSQADGPSVLSAPGLSAGTYYVRMTSASSSNPLMASFTEDPYELRLLRYYPSQAAVTGSYREIKVFRNAGEVLWAFDGTAFLKLYDGECYGALMENSKGAVVPVLIGSEKTAVEYIVSSTGERVTAGTAWHYEPLGEEGWYYSGGGYIDPYTEAAVDVPSLPMLYVGREGLRSTAELIADEIVEAKAENRQPGEPAPTGQPQQPKSDNADDWVMGKLDTAALLSVGIVSLFTAVCLFNGLRRPAKEETSRSAKDYSSFAPRSRVASSSGSSSGSYSSGGSSAYSDSSSSSYSSSSSSSYSSSGSSSYSSGGSSSSFESSTSERSFTEGGPTGCGIGGSFCGCGSGR